MQWNAMTLSKRACVTSGIRESVGVFSTLLSRDAIRWHFQTHESRVFSPEVVLFVIVISSVSLAFETPYQDPNSEAPWAMRWWDFFGTKFFQTEGSLKELRRWKKVFFWKIGSHAFVPGAVEKQSFHLSWREKMGSFPTWDLWSMCSHQTADYTRPSKGGLNHFCRFHELTEMSGCAILSTRRGDDVRFNRNCPDGIG